MSDIKEFASMSDPINQPRHYKKEGTDIQCIEAIEAALTPEEFKGFLKGNAMKYLWRCNDKNGVQDLEKGSVYQRWLVEVSKGAKIKDLL